MSEAAIACCERVTDCRGCRCWSSLGEKEKWWSVEMEMADEDWRKPLELVEERFSALRLKLHGIFLRRVEEDGESNLTSSIIIISVH